MRSRYANRDPHWITTRYTGTCATCARPIRSREEAFYYPAERRLLCHECGAEAQADFTAHAEDEERYQATYSRTPALYAQALRGELD